MLQRTFVPYPSLRQAFHSLYNLFTSPSLNAVPTESQTSSPSP